LVPTASRIERHVADTPDAPADDDPLQRRALGERPLRDLGDTVAYDRFFQAGTVNEGGLADVSHAGRYIDPLQRAATVERVISDRLQPSGQGGRL